MTRALALRYPQLYRLFAGYANQDFDLHGDEPLASVRAFARDATAAERRTALDELAHLRRARRSPTALARALDELRCGVDPQAFGWTGATFLDHVAAALVPSPEEPPHGPVARSR